MNFSSNDIEFLTTFKFLTNLATSCIDFRLTVFSHLQNGQNMLFRDASSRFPVRRWFPGMPGTNHRLSPSSSVDNTAYRIINIILEQFRRLLSTLRSSICSFDQQGEFISEIDTSQSSECFQAIVAGRSAREPVEQLQCSESVADSASVFINIYSDEFAFFRRLIIQQQLDSSAWQCCFRRKRTFWISSNADITAK
jgi:hypothetical protein